MGEQLPIPGTEQPPPTQEDRLRARQVAAARVRASRTRDHRRLIHGRCVACGEPYVVTP